MGCQPKTTGPLHWEPTRVQMKLEPGQRSVPLEFSWHNPSAQAVRVARVELDCDCLVVAGGAGAGWTAAPGERGTLRLDFHAGERVGRQERTLKVFFAGQERPAELAVRVDIPELVRVQPRVLIWELKGGVPTRTITVDGGGQGWKVLSAQTSNRRFAVEVANQGRLTRIRVTPDSTAVAASSLLMIETDCPYAPWNRITVPLRIQ